MTGYTVAAVWLFFCAAIILAFAAASRLQRRMERADAEYLAQRKPGMGDPRAVPPAVWAPNNPETWRTSAEPIYAELREQLAANNVCPSCALGKHALCTRALAPCDCPEHGRAA